MLRTKVGGIPLENPLMNASGCLCGTTDQLDNIANSEAAAIVTKSATVYSQKGNIEPRLYIDEFGTINSMGNPNPGFEYYAEYQTESHKPIFRSVYPYSVKELHTMMQLWRLLPVTTNVKVIELNLSCPNVGVDTNFGAYEQYFECINQVIYDTPVWGVKLPPFLHRYEFEHMSRMLLKYQPNFITSTNTMRGLLLDPELLPRIAPYEGLGGISGKYLKPFSLANVYQFSSLLEHRIDIIGCGGISTGQHVLEYMAAGASAVQIGSHFLREGTEVFAKIQNELLTLVGDRPIVEFIGLTRSKL